MTAKKQHPDFSQYRVISFDTYGTLIDWEAGIHGALSPLLMGFDDPPKRDWVLEQFAAAEADIQDFDPGLLYSTVLEAVYERLAFEWDVELTEGEGAEFAQAIADWPPFDDSVDALAYLRQHFKLATLTNCDHASYAFTFAALGEPFELVCTAEDIGSYKPAQANFDYLLEQVNRSFDCEPGQLLHVAQSLYHDIVPAHDMGLATVWIDRRTGQSGSGATKPAKGAHTGDWRYESLAEFAEAHRTHSAKG
ncbi:MAG: HAD hydrolase-like protein [Gammaproteobacteria bacterium AqS3]|nr:HAD hydrolase-like protein [Gammaproteobacteria bacterium AqS3]